MKRASNRQNVGIYDIVARLRAEGPRLSRNRNYELYESPRARRALRVHLLLRRVEEALLRRRATTRLTLRRCEDERLELCFEDPAVRYRRTVYLNPAEVELLCEHGEVARVLRSHGLDLGPPLSVAGP